MWCWLTGKSKRFLPSPEGPYSVGCVDVMNKLSKEGCFIRLHYPSSVDKSEVKESKYFSWVPDESYVNGFAFVVKVWVFVIRLAVWLLGGDVYVPAIWEAELKKDGKKMPVIVFSHGFGAVRFLYTTTCVELASRGYLIATIEHRDHSAATTYYYDSVEARDSDKRSWVQHQGLVCGRDHYERRNKQMKLRQAECVQVLDLLYEINNGKAQNILKSSFDLTQFKDNLDLSSACIMGHSFGGATSLYTLATEPRFKLGIILDGWMFPLKEEKGLNIVQPLLFINTQTFHIPSNLQVMDDYLTAADGKKHQLYTIRHTTHESQTDSSFVWGSWLNLFMKKLDPAVALKINNFLILQFLNQHFGLPQDVETCEKYLKENRENIVEDTILYTKKPNRQFSLTT